MNFMKENTPETILFCDDSKLFRRENLKREQTRPELCDIFMDGCFNTIISGSFIHRTPEGFYRMVYPGGELGSMKLHYLSAVSNDGVHFEKENDAAKRAGIPDPAAKNQYLPDFSPNSEIMDIFEDPFAEQEARYKMLVPLFDPDALIMEDVLYISGDMEHWKFVPNVRWHSRGAEPIGSCCYDADAGDYLIATRPDWGDRRIVGIRTRDWENFSKPELLITQDSQDDPLAEMYGLKLFRCGRTKLGLLLNYRPGNVSELCHKYLGGTITAELVYSPGGNAWQRTMRIPFAGDEYLMFWPGSMRKINGDFYITGAATECLHGDFYPKELKSCIVTYKTPEDRFISLTCEQGKTGSAALREVVWHGGPLIWNIRADHATAAVYDLTDGNCRCVRSHEDCQPFSGDCTAWEPVWNGHDSLDELTGHLLVPEIRMENGAVWSVKGNFTLLQTTEAYRYRKFRRLPFRRGY